MVTREMLEDRNAELHAELAEYEKACTMVRGALWENQNILTAMDELEEEDGNGISHNEVVPQPDGYCPEVPESWVEAPYEEDEAWHEVVEDPLSAVEPSDDVWPESVYPVEEEAVAEVEDGS